MTAKVETHAKVRRGARSRVPASKAGIVKHSAPPATASEIRELLGITQAAVADARRWLRRAGAASAGRVASRPPAGRHATKKATPGGERPRAAAKALPKKTAAAKVVVSRASSRPVSGKPHGRPSVKT
jgi:hypothetical protein